MKHKVGDRVRIKSIDWYNENKSKSHGTVACGGKYFDYDMREWCGKTMTILTAYQTCYIMEEDGAKDLWTDEMIECKVEEENTLSKNAKLVSERFSEYVNPSEVKYAQDTITKMLLQGANIPNEYILKDENGNIINATKIVLEKKKKEYPKTYDKCCEVLGIGSYFEPEIRNATTEECHKFTKLIRLKRCRDAYWKIAGEEMGLGKPWENSRYEVVYGICRDEGNIVKIDDYWGDTHIFEFPIREMRDAFKENFDPDIEICKELL